MRAFLHPFRPHPLLALLGSGVLLTLASVLLFAHGDAVLSMRETGLPAALRLSQIEKRAAVLQEQNEAAELQAALRTGTEQEILRLSVLPTDPALDRLLAVFDLLFAHLQERGMLRAFPAVHVGDVHRRTAEGLSWQSYPVTSTLSLTEDGVDRLFSFVHLAGMMTVSDVLAPADIDRLLALTEEHHPASITALEHFLSVDLLRYAETPRPYEDQLLAALSSPLFAEELRTMLDVPARRTALTLLRELAPALRERRLWPMRFLSLSEARIDRAEDGWMTVFLSLSAASRPGIDR